MHSTGVPGSSSRVWTCTCCTCVCLRSQTNHDGILALFETVVCVTLPVVRPHSHLCTPSTVQYLVLCTIVPWYWLQRVSNAICHTRYCTCHRPQATGDGQPMGSDSNGTPPGRKKSSTFQVVCIHHPVLPKAWCRVALYGCKRFISPMYCQ